MFLWPRDMNPMRVHQASHLNGEWVTDLISGLVEIYHLEQLHQVGCRSGVEGVLDYGYMRHQSL